MFEITSAKREILRHLTRQDWTPTELAGELGKSRQAVYNHLEDIADRGVLTRRKVPAKTRPRTAYSIGRGFVQFVSVLPDQYAERSLSLTRSKEAIVRIWSVPQEQYHPFLERYWWSLTNHDDVSFPEDVEAIAVYGSVARGEADPESDVDLLVVAADDRAADAVSEQFGTVRFETPTGTKLGLTEVYTRPEYRNSIVHGSDFLAGIRDELHAIYDPDRLLSRREADFDEY